MCAGTLIKTQIWGGAQASRHVPPVPPPPAHYTAHIFITQCLRSFNLKEMNMVYLQTNNYTSLFVMQNYKNIIFHTLRNKIQILC